MDGKYALVGSSLGKCGTFWKKLPFFGADIAGLGKYHTGGYGRIGVYRVKMCIVSDNVLPFDINTVSSAYMIIIKESSCTLGKQSFTYIIYRSGPKVEPWGAPCDISICTHKYTEFEVMYHLLYLYLHKGDSGVQYIHTGTSISLKIYAPTV